MLAYHYPAIDLNMIHFDKSPFQVTIKDTEGNIVLQSTIKKNGSVGKRFNIKKLPAGNYVFSIKTKFYDHEQSFSVYKKKELNLIYAPASACL